jgi:IclR family KDG regulon transcriptional repressor
MNTQEKNVTSTIKSVDKALTVLEAFSEVSGGINLSCLSEKLNMNKSGVYRLLQVFKQRGYVEQKCKNGKYQLGITAYRLGQNIVSNMELVRMARPIMEELVRDQNETVYIALHSEKGVLLFDSVDSSHAVNVMSLKGLHYPLDGCAAGDMLLAFATSSEENDLCKPSQNDVHLEILKRQDYRIDVHQLGDGVVSLAVPLLNADGVAAGSLCFVGPDFRFTDEKIKSKLLRPLIDAGHAISAKLGYFGYHLGQKSSYETAINS